MRRVTAVVAGAKDQTQAMRIGINALDMASAAGFAKAGVSRYCFNLIGALIELDSSHDFIVFVDPGFDPPALWRAHPRLTIVPARGKLSKRKMLWNLLVAGGEAKRVGVDVWLSLAHALPWRAPCPTVLTVHDLFTLLLPETVTRRYSATVGRILPRSIRVADQIIAVSEATRQDVLRLFPGKKPGDVTTIHLAAGNMVSRRASESVSEDDLTRVGVRYSRFLFTLSTLEPRKNLAALVEAFAAVRREPQFGDVGLVIGGAAGWMTSDVFRRVRDLGLQEVVAFLGYVDDAALPVLFARCEAFVCSSLVEGFGIPVLEAMVLGAPVVSSDRGSLKEVGGDAAGYFDPTDVESIASALREVLSHPERRNEAVQRGAQRAAQFSWQKTARETLGVLERTA